MNPLFLYSISESRHFNLKIYLAELERSFQSWIFYQYNNRFRIFKIFNPVTICFVIYLNLPNTIFANFSEILIYATVSILSSCARIVHVKLFNGNETVVNRWKLFIVLIYIAMFTSKRYQNLIWIIWTYRTSPYYIQMVIFKVMYWHVSFGIHSTFYSFYNSEWSLNINKIVTLYLYCCKIGSRVRIPDAQGTGIRQTRQDLYRITLGLLYKNPPFLQTHKGDMYILSST